jgi:hypothetical protein
MHRWPPVTGEHDCLGPGCVGHAGAVVYTLIRTAPPVGYTRGHQAPPAGLACAAGGNRTPANNENE